MGAGHHLVLKVRAGRAGAEEHDHHQRPGNEPLQRVGGGRTRLPDQKRREQTEEHQRLEEAEDQRERVADDRLEFAGEDVAVLVNGLGATPPEELYLIYRHLARLMQDRRMTTRQLYIGEYVTSLEMAGASVTLMRLDAELLELVKMPAECPMFSQR